MKASIKNDNTNIERIVDEWISKLVHGTIFQTETELYNKLQIMVPELKKRLINASSVNTEDKITSSANA